MQVQVECLAPVLHRSIGKHRLLVATGIVDEDVESSVLGFGASDHALDVSRACDVRFFDIDRNDRATLLNQPLDEHSPDSSRSAGHERDLAVEHRRYAARISSKWPSAQAARNARTTAGSNCVPAHPRTSASARCTGNAWRYGLWEIIASKASATARILAPDGICSCARPVG